MRQPRKRKIHFTVHTLHDGTVLAAYPTRKPLPKIIKRYRMRIDEDGCTWNYSGSGLLIGDPSEKDRFRFQNVIAANLNTRRAIRELVVAPTADLRSEMKALRAEIADLRAVILKRQAG